MLLKKGKYDLVQVERELESYGIYALGLMYMRVQTARGRAEYLGDYKWNIK